MSGLGEAGGVARLVGRLLTAALRDLALVERSPLGAALLVGGDGPVDGRGHLTDQASGGLLERLPVGATPEGGGDVQGALLVASAGEVAELAVVLVQNLGDRLQGAVRGARKFELQNDLLALAHPLELQVLGSCSAGVRKHPLTVPLCARQRNFRPGGWKSLS